jgi:hypothetical protein
MSSKLINSDSDFFANMVSPMPTTGYLVHVSFFNFICPYYAIYDIVCYTCDNLSTNTTTTTKPFSPKQVRVS